MKLQPDQSFGVPHAPSSLATLFLLLTCSAAIGASIGKPKKATKAGPGDAVREYVESVTSGRYEYTVSFEGTVDGTMTREPLGYRAYHQGFQPNLSVRLENVGETDVVNPWITVNGKRNWRTVEDIVAEATAGCQTDREKAIAIWEFEKHHRFHACTWDGECNDPVKVFNVYGYTLCGNDAHVISDLWRTAGLKVRRGFPIGHSTAEVFFDGKYHLLDGDENIVCLLRDNRTIASEADIVRDHDLMKRTHTYSILAGESRKRDEFSASLYCYEGKREGEYWSHIGHTMRFTLRPKESIEWRWDHAGKQYTAGMIQKPNEPSHDGYGDLLSGWGECAYNKMCNGKMVYAPELGNPVSQRGVFASQNVAWETDGGEALIRPADRAKPGYVAWQIRSPYVIVGGKVTAKVRREAERDSLSVHWSRDGKTWEDVWRAASTGTIECEVVLDEKLSVRRKPDYVYYVVLQMRGAAALESIRFDTDVQMSMASLPELEVGANKVRYVDDSPGARSVKITHRWIERKSARPPDAPLAPIFPERGATVEGTQFTFRWQPPADADGDKIVDYHFQLSDRKDLRWTLSPNFDRLSTLTPSRGKPEWTIPYVGLLNPDTAYYWRVRAKDAQGLWGPWSEVWSFQCKGPATPVNLEAVVNENDRSVTIRWAPNPLGRNPVCYKVYGSNEKGFTASDAPYHMESGRGFCSTLEEFESKKADDDARFYGWVKQPANLIGRTEGVSMQVVGHRLDAPNTNKAFYRVVAVDAKGNESCPSDYVEVPHPFIYTIPPLEAKTGETYTYKAKCIFSIGDLTCFNGYNAAFWHRERLTYSMAKGPPWLKIDPKTGVVSGVPRKEDAGPHVVVLVVKNSEGGQTEQRFTVVAR